MKLDQLISKYGTYIANRNDCNYINKILEIANFEKIMQYKPQQLKRVIFVTPKMHTGMGGLTSVLRIAKRLESKGLEISFTCYESNDVKKMRQEAHNNLDSFDAIYITYDKAKLNNYDFVISTNWESVFFARYIKGHQIYFMQDYEPYFYPISEKYFLAKKSLELGESIISLGKRNVEQLRKNINIKNIKSINSISFPFEPSEYSWINRDYTFTKKEINLAVYVKREPKRMTNLIQNLLCKAYEELYRKGIKLNVFFFGLNIHEKVSIGKNLGKLSKSQLINLYSHCDLGMVASMTNISLVPYEMIATGLPIIEFEDGSFSSFFENRSSFLINFDYKNIVEVIEGAVCGEVPLKEIAANAYNQIKKLSWDKTSEEFYNILLSIIIQK